MKPSFKHKFAKEIDLFKKIYLQGRDIKAARNTLEQNGVHPRIISRIADFVISSFGSSSHPFSGGRRGLTDFAEKDSSEILELQKRAGIITELDKGDSLTRKYAHKRAMKQFDEITKPLAKLSSLAFDADITVDVLVEELREMVLEMYDKKKDRHARKPKPEEFDPF